MEIGVGLLSSLVSLASFSYILWGFSATAPLPLFGYDLDDSRLTVYSHVHRKEFDSVIRCARIEQPNLGKMRFGVRLFGNGGLFAGQGFFWNRLFGVFRAYVTSARPSDLVLVETTKRKIVISPQDAQAFVAAWESSRISV